MAYKFASPLEWLESALTHWDETRVRSTLLQLAQQLDSDELQDLFQSEMDDDGYFEETPAD